MFCKSIVDLLFCLNGTLEKLSIAVNPHLTSYSITICVHPLNLDGDAFVLLSQCYYLLLVSSSPSDVCVSHSQVTR